MLFEMEAKRKATSCFGFGGAEEDTHMKAAGLVSGHSKEATTRDGTAFTRPTRWLGDRTKLVTSWARIRLSHCWDGPWDIGFPQTPFAFACFSS